MKISRELERKIFLKKQHLLIVEEEIKELEKLLVVTKSSSNG